MPVQLWTVPFHIHELFMKCLWNSGFMYCCFFVSILHFAHEFWVSWTAWFHVHELVTSSPWSIFRMTNHAELLRALFWINHLLDIFAICPVWWMSGQILPNSNHVYAFQLVWSLTPSSLDMPRKILVIIELVFQK